MRALVALTLLLSGLAVAGHRAGSARDAEDGTEEVLAAVHALFDAMRAGDTAALEALFHPDARLVSVTVREGTTVVSAGTVEGFVRSVGSARVDLDERVGGEEVRIDGRLATAWTPYAFFADGEFSHCGVNAFQLVRTDEGWKILQITDTRRREACPADAPL